MYLAVLVGKFVKHVVREWCPSTTGPLLPTMTNSLLAPGREVPNKRYHTSELIPATILGPSKEMILCASSTPKMSIIMRT